jgi:sugar lactone lactonase YvrE
VLVADTWNHRVIASHGAHDDSLLEPPPEGWYGPRAVAVAADGWVVVSDTGHHRLVLYAELDGAPHTVLHEGDGWDELLEPGGVAWLGDGSLVVCDTGHRRLLQLDRSGRLQREVVLPDAWPDYYSRPQIAALSDTLWLVSDTPQAALWLVRSQRVMRIPFDADGAAPTGVAWDLDTRTLAIGDLAGRVWLLEVADE